MKNVAWESRQHRLYLGILYFAFTGAVFLMLFAVLAKWRQDEPLFYTLTLFGVASAALSLFVLRTGNVAVGRWWAMGILLGLYFYLLLEGAYENTGYIWCFAFYPVPYFLFGHRTALMVTMSMLALSATALFWPSFSLLVADYPEPIRTRFVASSLVLSLLTYFHAWSVAKADEKVFALTRHIQELARTDDLTTIPNRRAATETLQTRLMDLGRYAEQFGLLMFDIDHFKHINDRWGHDAGDRALIEVSHLVRVLLRQTDFFARWGGEEFLVLLPYANEDETCTVAEKIRASVANQDFHLGTATTSITVSVGATTVRQADDMEKALRRVDEALYEAKNAGRNKVVFRRAEDTVG